MARLKITARDISLTVETLESKTAAAVLAAVPFESLARRWGDEVYFDAPVSTTLESDARDVVEPGEIAFWVEGSCIAIGFGPTPVSERDEIRLATATNIWARTTDDVRRLSAVRNGDRVKVEKA